MTKEERKPCIYKATSKTTGLSYIGQCRFGINRRKSQHIDRAFKKNRQTLFCTALRDLGIEDFEWSILETVDPSLSPEMLQEQLNFLERHYVKVYNSYNNGYNMGPGGDGGVRYKYATLEEKEQAKRERQRELRAANREKVNARQNAKRAANREKVNKRQNAKRAANKEAWNKRQRELRAANKEAWRKRQKERRAANKEKVNKKQKDKRDANREAWREAFNERRRKRKESLKKKIRKGSLKKKKRKQKE